MSFLTYGGQSMGNNNRYESCMEVLTDIEYIFMKNEVIIIGDYQINDIVTQILNHCRTRGLYRDIKISSYGTMKAEEDMLFHELCKEDNKCKAIVICNEFQRFDRKFLNLIKSGFERIISGIDLINAGYCEIYFNVNSKIDKQKVTDANDFCLNNNRKLDSSIKSKLNTGDAYEGFLLAAEQHKKNGEYLRAYDYYNMAYSTSGNAHDLNQLNDLQIKINFNDLSDHEIVTSLQKIISLNFYGRSGSIYCGGLLEGHSQIMMLPPGIVYSPYINIYTLFYATKGNTSVQEIIEMLDFQPELIVQYNECITIKVEQQGSIYPAGYGQKFKIVMTELLIKESEVNNGIISESFLYKALVYAHTKALGRNIDVRKGLPYILDQQHENNGKMVSKFISFFEYNRVLVTVRNITQNFGSMLAMMERQQLFIPQRALNLFKYFSFNSVLCNLTRDYYVFFLQIEKVNLSPKETMMKLCNILHIDYEDGMERPTLNGFRLYDAYGSNTYNYGARKEGIEKKYDKYLTDNDKLRLTKLFTPLLNAMNYAYDKEGAKKIDWNEEFLFYKNLMFQNDEEKTIYRLYIKRVCDEILDRETEIIEYLKNTETI